MDVWIVGLVRSFDPFTENGDRITGAVWEFIGVFDDESLAVDSCLDDRFFVGPADMNGNLGEKQIEWSGAYFPTVKEGDE